MHHATASGRLVKDILFKFIQDAGHKCYRCGGNLTRETFSIEHKESWLDSHDPVGLYFDLDNIAFSHFSCNISAANSGRKVHKNVRARRDAENVRRNAKWKALPKEERRKIRRSIYEKYGC